MRLSDEGMTIEDLTLLTILSGQIFEDGLRRGSRKRPHEVLGKLANEYRDVRRWVGNFIAINKGPDAISTERAS